MLGGRRQQLGVALGGLAGDEQLGDGAGPGDRLAHGLRPLGEEPALAGPEGTLGETPSRLHPPGPDAGELGSEGTGGIGSAGRRRVLTGRQAAVSSCFGDRVDVVRQGALGDLDERGERRRRR